MQKPTETSLIDFQALKSKWPSTIVARSRIKDFTGGLISPGTMANEDSRGTGPNGRFMIGNKTAYPVDSLIGWLEAKAKKTGKPANPSRKRKV